MIYNIDSIWKNYSREEKENKEISLEGFSTRKQLQTNIIFWAREKRAELASQGYLK